jgi:hypothetical protein
VACRVCDPRAHLGARLSLRNVVHVGLTCFQSVVLPHALWYVVLAYPTVMLYGNSVLGSLNARVVLRSGTGNAPSSESYALSSRIAHRGTRGLGGPRLANHSDPVALVSSHKLYVRSAMADMITGVKHEAADDRKVEDGPHDMAVDLPGLAV